MTMRDKEDLWDAIVKAISEVFPARLTLQSYNKNSSEDLRICEQKWPLLVFDSL